MHPQLTKLASQLDGVSDLAQSLVEGMLLDQMRLRPEPDRWSVAECFEHLNLFSESFVHSSNEACQRARQTSLFGSGLYKMDRMGRVVKWMMQPPPHIKMRTAESFEPTINGPLEDVIPRFLSLQVQLKTRIADADGLDLNKVILLSPFSKRRKYNLYSCLVLIVTHQLRHLWQAEQAKRSIR